MSLGDSTTFYDVLDTTPDASPQEVRDAYVRVKSTYTKDSVALYTLVTPDEREDILKRIEEAYHILSDPEKRREYDRNYGLLNNDFMPAPVQELDMNSNIVSIDRVPPMENAGEEDLLIPPSTDIPETSALSSTAARPTMTLPKAAPPAEHKVEPADVSETPLQPPTKAPSISYSIERRTKTTDLPSLYPTVDPTLMRDIENETEWKGSFLKKVREAYKVSIEEMSATTKVSKNYLVAIEEENYPKLPAPVYLRGFVMQISRVLKLPADKVASSYLGRYNKALAARP